MSSVPKSLTASGMLRLRPFEPMRIEDLSEVQAIENDLYPHPWTRGNFLDSMYSGYETWVLRTEDDPLVGYFLVMLALDEAHLLNITVRRDLHGQGLGRYLLDQVKLLAREKNMNSIFLEVRPSNARAKAVYERYGFSQIGRRKGYYPGLGNTREDAIVMRLVL